MDNGAIARLFVEIADLLEIKGENAFKIRAYRSAADTIKAWPDAVARMSDADMRGIPGIGKDLAAKLREIADTGVCAYRQGLLEELPLTILDVLRLPGVGPKTVAMLYASLNVRSVDDLAAAATAGHLRGIKGMGAKKEEHILKAIRDREQTAGRHLLSETAVLAAELTGYLRERVPNVELVPVGSLRRGCETCGDIDILAVGADTTIMDTFIAHPKVEQVLGRGDTKSSVRLHGGYQADLRLVPAESRGAAMQYFTGSKAHNIVVRDRATRHGFKLNEYGLFRLDDDVRVAGASEESIYDALGMAWIEPELRENRGEIDAAVAHALPRLLTTADIRGDLHMHTTATDGRDTIEAMAAAAQRRGYQYIAITDHSQALAMANGMDERRTLEHAARVRALNGQFEGLTLLAGIECDILADGTLDLADECLAQLDLVVVSIHSHFNQDEAQMTDRVLRAMECPWVDIVGHPTGRRLLAREPFHIDMEQIASAAARLGVALEINSQANRLDLNESHARMARERGASLVVSTDAHAVAALNNLQWGIHIARRAWTPPEAVLNTRSLDELRAGLRRHRSAAIASRNA